MSGDPFEDYLARLAAGLRTPPARTAEIAAEAEDHLRESAAARRADGLGEDEAQRAAITAFGSVRQVVRAHRPSAGAYALAAAMLAWPLLAGYLVLTAALGALLLVVQRLAARRCRRAGLVPPRPPWPARYGAVARTRPAAPALRRPRPKAWTWSRPDEHRTPLKGLAGMLADAQRMRSTSISSPAAKVPPPAGIRHQASARAS